MIKPPIHLRVRFNAHPIGKPESFVSQSSNFQLPFYREMGDRKSKTLKVIEELNLFKGAEKENNNFIPEKQESNIDENKKYSSQAKNSMTKEDIHEAIRKEIAHLYADTDDKCFGDTILGNDIKSTNISYKRKFPDNLVSVPEKKNRLKLTINTIAAASSSGLTSNCHLLTPTNSNSNFSFENNQSRSNSVIEFNM